LPIFRGSELKSLKRYELLNPKHPNAAEKFLKES
jgi:hypothetical protein